MDNVLKISNCLFLNVIVFFLNIFIGALFLVAVVNIGFPLFFFKTTWKYLPFVIPISRAISAPLLIIMIVFVLIVLMRGFINIEVSCYRRYRKKLGFEKIGLWANILYILATLYGLSIPLLFSFFI